MPMSPGRLCRIAEADETNIPDAFYEKVALWSESNTWGSLLEFIGVNQLVLLIEIDEEGYAQVVWKDMIGFLHTDYLKIIA